MSRDKNIARNTWYGLMLIMLVFLVYSSLVLGKPTTLKGAQAVKAKPKFSKVDWFTERYQKRFERSASSNFAFYTPLVKLHNQWKYNMWDEANARDVIFGEDGYLFEKGYINGLYGTFDEGRYKRFKGIKNPISFAHAEFEEKGNQLVFIIMPSKAFFHPTKIPKNLQKEIPEKHLHDDFLTFAQANNLNVIDFQDYFLEEQENIPYPIFPKQGIHISEYAETIVLDSLLRFVEKEESRKIYDYHFSEVEETVEPRRRDNDIGQALNLIWPMPSEEVLGYRNFILDKIDKENDPKVLLIGDSFYWGLYPIVSHHRIFSHHEFWYRNNQIFSPGVQEQRFSNKAACIEAIEKFDLTFIMVTSNAIEFSGWGFFENIYEERYVSDLPKEAWGKINQIITRIKNDKDHLNHVREKALKENISLDSMLLMDAKWIYFQEL